MKNISIIIGTKAQLVKMAPIMKLMLSRNTPFNFIWTGQHRETIDELIQCFDIRQPDIIWVPDMEADTKFKLFKWLFAALSNGIRSDKLVVGRDTIILVHGDTLSAFVGALIARIKGAKVLHIEAGLRSYNWLNPFPEEILRILTSYLTNYFACSSEWACENALRFTKKKSDILNTQNNTLIDSTILALDTTPEIDSNFNNYCIASIHRVENISNQRRLALILNQIIRVSETITVLFVLHPATRKKMEATGWLKKLQNIRKITLMERMNYIDFCHLLNNANFLISDGGSNQEECSYLKLPCLLMRKATERNEGMEENTFLSNYDENIVAKFVRKFSQTKRKPILHEELKDVNSPSEMIVDFLAEQMVVEPELKPGIGNRK